MASFPTHISFGIALGVLGVMVLTGLAFANAPSFLVVVFALATLGSVLPDMDSDSGIPFHVAFGSLTVVTAVLAFSSVHKTAPHNWRILLTSTMGTAVFVWVVVGYFFKRITHHRGMAHSIPAALLSGLIAFFLATKFSFADIECFILGVATTAGFVLHLVLDEIWAGVNFHGHLFSPNKAFGSALKLWSDSTLVNVLVYGAILFFTVGNMQTYSALSKQFFRAIMK